MKYGRGIKIIVQLLIIFSMLVVLPITASSQFSQQINYQGYLTDASGNPIDDYRQMVFAIYDVAIGGNPLWWEQQNVKVINGIFNVLIGQYPETQSLSSRSV